jgi:hypothetical protein
VDLKIFGFPTIFTGFYLRKVLNLKKNRWKAAKPALKATKVRYKRPKPEQQTATQ